MKTIASLTVAALAGICLTSCAETTGNPREGGFFGWSESKAQDRLDARRYEADRINADTDRINAENSNLRRRLH